MELFAAAKQLYQKAIDNTIDESDMDTVIAWPYESLSVLFACADQVRRHFFADALSPCSLMNIKSGGCGEDCAFCAQSAHNHTAAPVTNLAGEDEIVARARQAAERLLPLCVVSSGRRLPKEELVWLADVLKKCPVEKHASLGILDEHEFALLRNAGVVCYNHNVESSRSFFPRVVGSHSYDERVETVRRAKRAGMRVCCGGIFGMGETWQQRKEMCLEIRALGVDTVPLNFLLAIPGTRLAPPSEPPLEFLRVISLFRIVMPSKIIKVCGGREAVLGSLQSLVFFAGANGYVTGGYLTTQGAGIDADDALVAALSLRRK